MIWNSDSFVALHMHSRCYLLTLTLLTSHKALARGVLGAQISRSYTTLVLPQAPCQLFRVLRCANMHSRSLFYSLRWNSDLNLLWWCIEVFCLAVKKPSYLRISVGSFLFHTVNELLHSARINCFQKGRKKAKRTVKPLPAFLLSTRCAHRYLIHGSSQVMWVFLWNLLSVD